MLLAAGCCLVCVFDICILELLQLSPNILLGCQFSTSPRKVPNMYNIRWLTSPSLCVLNNRADNPYFPCLFCACLPRANCFLFHICAECVLVLILNQFDDALVELVLGLVDFDFPWLLLNLHFHVCVKLIIFSDEGWVLCLNVFNAYFLCICCGFVSVDGSGACQLAPLACWSLG